MRMSATLRLGGALLGVALGCDSVADANVMARVLAYMECDECSAGELRAVRAEGDQATPILRQFVLSGPPAERKDRKREELIRWEARVLHDSSTALLPATQRLLDNYTVRYRRRAAIALGHINTPAARAALCAAGLGPC